MLFAARDSGLDLVLCHTTADFDTLGAAVGIACLKPGHRIVLTGGCHPAVREFLALHRDEYPLIERRSVNPKRIRSLTVVDTQQRDRLGKAAEWLDLPHLDGVDVYDHHLETARDIDATYLQVESVGATATLIAEKLRSQQVEIGPAAATVMALGIHVDTGSLTFDHATPRDAIALAWTMEQGASLSLMADYIEPGLSPSLQELLAIALDCLHSETVRGATLSWVVLETEGYVPGLSSLAARLMELTESDVLLLGARYGEVDPKAVDPEEMAENKIEGEETCDLTDRLTIVARSQLEETNLGQLLHPWGGGGHPRAAAAMLRRVNPDNVLAQLIEQLKQQIPAPLNARELMSSPVRTIRPDTSIEQAQRILLRYGHSGLSVVNAADELVGVISRRDLDIALHHGFGHAPVKGYMTANPKTIVPETTLPEIESLMVTYDIGRLPVLEGDRLVGIVTRTDVLRQLHRDRSSLSPSSPLRDRRPHCPWPASLLADLRSRLVPPLWQLLETAAQLAEARGWQLYIVGGAVRDFLVADASNPVALDDVDLVVDGFHRAADGEAGVALAKALQASYPAARLQVHGQFQTAALLWHRDPELDSLWIDIATARTEFYPYPAANPEVEASSIRQDLYRRDFTINALAIRLTGPQKGELLDYFGGLLDLQQRHIRVLHVNSFIEDPTRIYRAVRFAVRLGFQIEAQTEESIRHAIASGVYLRVQSGTARAPALETRLKSELKYILQAPYWRSALSLLADLGALRCIHPQLALNRDLWRQLRLVDYCLHYVAQLSVTDWQGHPDLPTSATDRWHLLLEVLLASLPTEESSRVARILQLPSDSIERLRMLQENQTQLEKGLSQSRRLSEIVACCRQYDVGTLISIAARSPRSLKRLLWCYLTDWSQVKPPLNGRDLKAMGYKPGPQFRQILDDLLAAKLDGAIAALIPPSAAHNEERSSQRKLEEKAFQSIDANGRTYGTVEEFLKRNYPLPEGEESTP